MAVSKKDVEHVAKLARLGLTEKEKDLFTSQLNQILEYAESINKLDTQNIEPTTQVIQMPTPYRKDSLAPYPFTSDILKNGPEHEKSMFKVPRILD